MKNYYRIMLGRKSIYAEEAFKGNFILRLRIPPGSVLGDEAGKKEAEAKPETPSGSTELTVEVLRAGGGFVEWAKKEELSFWG